MTERMRLGEATLAANEQENASCEQPFAALVERQARFVFQVAFAALRHSQDAEDVAQDVFLKLYRSGAWRQMKDERAYLARAAWRAAGERRAIRARHGFDPLREDAPCGLETPEEAALQANWAAVVHQLMDGLPEELRAPLVLASMEEFTSAGIAQALGIAEGTVRTRVMRGREILKEKLARLMGARHGR